MECGLGSQESVHNFGHFITSVLHNFGSALYIRITKNFKILKIQKSNVITI